MAHLWEDWWQDPKKTPAQRFMGARERRCMTCGAVQYEHKEHAWGRVTGRRWQPLVGRCKPSAP